MALDVEEVVDSCMDGSTFSPKISGFFGLGLAGVVTGVALAIDGGSTASR